MGAEDDIKGILGVASQVCFCGTVVAAARKAYGHWLHRTCPRCGGAARLRCEHCDASGKLQRPTKRDDFINVMEEETGTFPCMFCQGTGSVTCRTCKGAGARSGAGSTGDAWWREDRDRFKIYSEIEILDSRETRSIAPSSVARTRTR